MSTDDNLTYRAYICAVLDILGQRDAIRRLAGIVPDEAHHPQLIEVLRNSIGVRDSVRDELRKTCEFFVNTPPQPVGAELSEEAMKVYQQVRERSITFDSFGDTIVMHCPVIGKADVVNIASIFGILTSAALLVLVRMAHKTPIRGGIDIGFGVEPGGTELYGPAFLNAYELEQNVADYPRIVIGQQLVSSLKQMATSGEGTVLTARCVRALAQVCSDFIARDKGGTYFLNYLGRTSKQVLTGGAPNLLELYPMGRSFVEKEEQKFAECGNLKLARRYAALVRYFAANAENWAPG